MIPIKTARQIEAMRKAGRIVGELLQAIGEEVRPGVTTKELDKFAEEFIRKKKAQPAFKGYHGYPATICASVNEEVVHGIPGARKLEDGDIIGIDVGVLADGFNGDAAFTFAVGDVDKEKRLLIESARTALEAGISKAKAGNHLYDISSAVQAVIEPYGFGIVTQYAGHGIGAKLHEEPQVPNYGRPGNGPVLQQGMALAIEPMVNAGTYEVVVAEDGWTVRTKDGAPSAHFEHTVLVTNGVPEILTAV